MFSQACVIPSVHRGELCMAKGGMCAKGVVMHGKGGGCDQWGHAW